MTSSISQMKTHILYDDLTLTQWAMGQLNNVYQMKDTWVLRQLTPKVSKVRQGQVDRERY